MTEPENAGRPPVKPEEAALAALLMDQCSHWQRGERVLVESYLAQQPELAGDVRAVIDLIVNEMLLREDQGETVSLAEYVQRFPHLEAQLRIHFEEDQAPQMDTGAVGTTLLGETLPAVESQPAPTAGKEPRVTGYELL